jgi:hypothetical protein
MFMVAGLIGVISVELLRCLLKSLKRVENDFPCFVYESDVDTYFLFIPTKMLTRYTRKLLHNRRRNEKLKHAISCMLPNFRQGTFGAVKCRTVKPTCFIVGAVAIDLN